jgi:hypothetical protein
VYRPYSTCVASDGKVWSVGPAGWGSTGAGVAFVDPESGTSASTRLPAAPHDVLPLSGNRLLVCGADKIRWWDGTTNEQIAEKLPPLPLVSGSLLPGNTPDRVLLAARDKLAVASVEEPGRVDIEREFACPIPCLRALALPGRAVVGGPQGFAVIDLVTGVADHFCSTPLGQRWAYTIAGEAVFFARGTRLMTVTLPGKETVTE